MTAPKAGPADAYRFESHLGHVFFLFRGLFGFFVWTVSTLSPLI
jgi:hypothetical protein